MTFLKNNSHTPSKCDFVSILIDNFEVGAFAICHASSCEQLVVPVFILLMPNEKVSTFADVLYLVFSIFDRNESP